MTRCGEVVDFEKRGSCLWFGLGESGSAGAMQALFEVVALGDVVDV